MSSPPPSPTEKSKNPHKRLKTGKMTRRVDLFKLPYSHTQTQTCARIQAGAPSHTGTKPYRVPPAATKPPTHTQTHTHRYMTEPACLPYAPSAVVSKYQGRDAWWDTRCGLPTTAIPTTRASASDLLFRTNTGASGEKNLRLDVRELGNHDAGIDTLTHSHTHPTTTTTLSRQALLIVGEWAIQLQTCRKPAPPLVSDLDIFREGT